MSQTLARMLLLQEPRNEDIFLPQTPEMSQTLAKLMFVTDLLVSTMEKQVLIPSSFTSPPKIFFGYPLQYIMQKIAWWDSLWWNSFPVYFIPNELLAFLSPPTQIF